MPCTRCGRPALDELCATCRNQSRKRRRIHVIIDDSDDDNDEGHHQASQPVPLSPLLDSGDVIMALDVDEDEDEDGLEHATQFSLNSDFLCSGHASPQLLSDDDGEDLPDDPEPLVNDCPQADTTPSPVSQPAEDDKELPDVPLRVLYWNLERFGGEAQWGLKETRADEVMLAIAQLIDLADPHFVVLVEVMAHKGRAEVERLLACLNALTKRWQYVMPDGVTGCTEGKPASGESYAVLYEAGVGIEPVFARIGMTKSGQAFPVASYSGKNGERTAFRAPGEFLFQMGGPYALKDGSRWPLGIVALHAPGPQANRERQEQIEKVIHDLRLLELVSSPADYPDVLVCADFNSHPDAYNISKEPDKHTDIALHRQNALPGGGDGPSDVGEAAIALIADIQQRERRAATRQDRPYPKRTSNKVVTRVVAQKAKLLETRERKRLQTLIEDNDLEDEQRHGRSGDVREWRQGIEGILDQLRELEEEYEALALAAVREHFQRQPLHGAQRRAARAPDDVLRDYEEQREALLAELQELEPRIGAIHYVEDMVEVIDTVRRAGSASKRREAQFKRELKSQLKTVEEEDKMVHREQAYASLDPAPSASVTATATGGQDTAPDDDGAWEGFFSDLSTDTDLKTTRRRAITVLRTKGKLGKLQLPDGADSLLFSKYDQVLARTLGHLRRPDNVCLPVLVAVLSAAAIERLLGAAADDDPDNPNRDDLTAPHCGGDSALAGIAFHRLPGLLNPLLKSSDTWRVARGKSFTNVNKHIAKGNLTDEQRQVLADGATSANLGKLEDADPPNFHVLQLALYLSRALSDHDPMLAGYWVDRQLTKKSRLEDSGGHGGNLARPPHTEAGDDYFDALLGMEQQQYQALCVAEGGPQLLATLMHHHFQSVIMAMGRRRIGLEAALQCASERIAPAYTAAIAYCTGALDGDTFSARPGAICNIGNTCYMNATLQVLAASPFYRGQIAHAQPSALKSVLEWLVRTLNHGALVIPDLAELLRQALIDEGWHHGYREQDPSELLLLIANKLRFVPPWRLSQRFVPQGGDPDQVQPTYTQEHIVALDMPHPGQADAQTQRLGPAVPILDCLADFLDSRTDQNAALYRTLHLAGDTDGPLQLKRFAAHQLPSGALEAHVIRTPLSGAELLDLPLCAVIVQLGGDSLNTGHYHAYVIRNGRMYRCNDHHVDDVTGQQAQADALAHGYVYVFRNA